MLLHASIDFEICSVNEEVVLTLVYSQTFQLIVILKSYKNYGKW